MHLIVEWDDENLVEKWKDVPSEFLPPEESIIDEDIKASVRENVPPLIALHRVTGVKERYFVPNFRIVVRSRDTFGGEPVQTR
tara:strand:- start:108 stop:356 length:249 start_codon:yes stop_codon:yes gene_type:complete